MATLASRFLVPKSFLLLHNPFIFQSDYFLLISLQISKNMYITYPDIPTPHIMDNITERIKIKLIIANINSVNVIVKSL